jgi:GTP-binding protein YchF
MKIGLIGLQKSGKSTIFTALTGIEVEISAYQTGKVEPNLGVVTVADERITKLSEMYQPKKTIYATIEFIDFAGLSGNAKGGEIFSGSSIGLIKNTDALALVVRNFNDDMINELMGKPNPLNDIENVESELILSDLIIAEKRLEKIELQKKRGIKTTSLAIEETAIKKIIDHLGNDKPIRTLELTDDEEKEIRGFQFISQKPLMIILNSDEDNFGNNTKLIDEISKKYKVEEFAGKFEMELAAMDEEDRKAFMEDMNITSSAKDRLTKAAYELLGYISFFTVGKDEVRAWTITNGANAVEAAGKIHTDLARGFIRAETFSYDDLMKYGSEKVLREKGHFRLEGKEYIVKDGDILNIRFSV